MIRKCLENDKLTVWGDGSPTRSFLFVEDAAKAVVLATKNYNKSCPVNISSSEETSIQDLVEIIVELTGFKGKIEFDTTKGYLLIEGRSIPENSIDFFEPFIEFLENYSKTPLPLTEVDFRLEYFNTSSSKCILDILRLLQKIHLDEDSQIKINWFYDEDDDEIQEIGQDYSHIINVPFNIKLIES